MSDEIAERSDSYFITSSSIEKENLLLFKWLLKFAQTLENFDHFYLPALRKF